MLDIKLKFKIGRILTVVLPVLCSILLVLHCICDFYEIESRLFSYLGGTSIIIWVYFLYNSYLFGLCTHHRMFIYYLVFYNSMSIIDNYYSIPLTDAQYLSVCVIAFGLAVLLYGYLKFRDNKKARK